MIPFSDVATDIRTCCCWNGGKKSMMRVIVSTAPIVCSVESTRCPVSAAESAAHTVSGSRISPMRITSGSWRSTRLQRVVEVVGVGADLALVHDRALVGVQHLDRVLDRHDVARLSAR